MLNQFNSAVRRLAGRMALLALAGMLPALASAATILQAPNAQSVAFEAEDNLAIIGGAPTSWVITNDVTPSGNRALYASGANGTASPTSFASYSIRFGSAGTYKLYFRWRANEQFTDADPNAGNSFYAPLVFNAGTAPLNPNPDYSASTVNNMRNRPESNTYHVDSENTALLTVSQEQVDAGQPLALTLGTREAGLMFDRIVLSQDPSMSETTFNATPNSDTDVYVQPAGANYVAFEAESPKVKLVAGTPTSWVITNDVTPSGATALYASGANGTAFPTSFASYLLRFSSAGTYKLYFRWRANQQFTDADPNAANSFYAPLVFDANINPVNPNPDYSGSTVNNTRNRPESNTYHVDSENTALLTVSQEQVDAGQPLRLSIGTREAGLMFDRIVLSQDQSLTETGFNALENTGATDPILIAKAVGSATLDTIKLTFNKAIDPNAVFPDGFTVSGGVAVLNAVTDPVTLKDILLTTSPQSEGVDYTVTVNDIYDLAGTPIAPNSTISFTAWVLAQGFTRREHYFSIPGTDVASLQSAPKFPNSPDRVDVVKGVTSPDPRAQNYGVRLSGFFIPSQSGVYEFYMYNNDSAQLSLGTDASAGSLQPLINAATSAGMAFDPGVMGTTPATLVAGQRYALQVLLKQGADYDVFLNVGARRVGDTTPVDQLPPLVDQVGTLVDPTAISMQITRQPASAVVLTGRRARFDIAAQSPGGPAFYQWQVNGTDAPGATRAAYYTPVLSAADNGKSIRCIVHAGGIIATSAVATVTVQSAPLPVEQPYIGVNFVGGDAAGASGSLRPIDVTGVVPQANFNNVAGASVTEGPLVDAHGEATPATIAYTALTYFTGTGENTAEDVLFQGYLHHTNGSVVVALNHLPITGYDLYAYCVGFTYNATYEQGLSVMGSRATATLRVRAEHAADYSAAPGVFRPMASTDPNARQQGNYVVFQNVVPNSSGTLTLTVVNESDNPLDIDVTPALSGLQLVRVAPRLALRVVPPALEIEWGADAAGYNLEASDSLGANANWQPVTEANNPLIDFGSITLSPAGLGKFYRLKKDGQ